MLTDTSLKPTSRDRVSAFALARLATVVVAMALHLGTITTTAVVRRAATARVVMTIVAALHRLVTTTATRAKTVMAHLVVVAHRWMTIPHHRLAIQMIDTPEGLHHHAATPRTRT